MRFWPAYAKVNLTLEVLGRRPDGYHEISTVMQTVGLHDLVGLDRAAASTFTASGLAVSPGPDNLVRRAQAALEQAADRRIPAHVHLHKRIPIGAGLGGGSSDAATVLRGLNHLFDLGLPRAGLEACAAGLGQDLPFLLEGGTAWATGRGDRLEPLPDVARGWVILTWPDTVVDTGAVYRAAGDTVYSRGERSLELVRRLKAGNSVLPETLHNDLEAVAAGSEPRVAELCEKLQALGRFHMTGSGGAFYAWFAEHTAARQAQARLGALATALCPVVPRWST